MVMWRGMFHLCLYVHRIMLTMQKRPSSPDGRPEIEKLSKNSVSNFVDNYPKFLFLFPLPALPHFVPSDDLSKAAKSCPSTP